MAERRAEARLVKERRVQQVGDGADLADRLLEHILELVKG